MTIFPPPNFFGGQLRAMRADRGLSLRHVARAAGISAGFLTDIEHGRRMPSRSVLERLAAAVERPAADLLRFDPRENVEEVLATVAARPEIALVLAKICRRVQSGHMSPHALERMTQE